MHRCIKPRVIGQVVRVRRYDITTEAGSSIEIIMLQEYLVGDTSHVAGKTPRRIATFYADFHLQIVPGRIAV